jgi:hypothetical protein
VIFDRAKGKAKRDESTGKDGSNRLGKKKNKKNNGGLARGHCRPQGSPNHAFPSSTCTRTAPS